MDWTRQALLNTPSLLLEGDPEKEFSESGGEGDEDDQVHDDDRLGDGGGIPEKPLSSSKLASICLLDRTGSWLLSTE